MPFDAECLRPRLLRQALALSGRRDEAEDLVQDCLVVLLGRGRQIRDPQALLPWCHAVLRNLWRQRLRRRWATEALGAEPQADPWPDVEAGIAVGEAIAELPPPVRRAVRSFYFGGETIRMIAAHESRPEGTIKRWLHEGREALRMALAEAPESAPLARVYASDWLADAERDVLGALTEAGYRAERCELPEDESPPTDAALYVFGQQAGARSGLELLLALRASDGGAHLPTVLFGPSRHTAILAAWQAGADVYLTDPSSPELSHFLRKLRDMPAPRDMAPQ